jgi:hypothetical protein
MTVVAGEICTPEGLPAAISVGSEVVALTMPPTPIEDQPTRSTDPNLERAVRAAKRVGCLADVGGRVPDPTMEAAASFVAGVEEIALAVGARPVSLRTLRGLKGFEGSAALRGFAKARKERKELQGA